MVFVRGQIGQDLDTSENVGIGDVTAQAVQAMTNIDMLLKKPAPNWRISPRSSSTSSIRATGKPSTGWSASG